ncbi:hypothetical protein pVco7_gp057 [Vibrio phage pVco-7]|uniref:Uncharacterized protein n=1 Tax=Vibrio phage pVco-5 TaxID=1965485 RepID=A0A1W6JUW6_9CAUD|nr:hypothetical protein KNT61_gp058 [Vibrio phage pVco-5]ARM71046.1 hypothetical protein pVco5_058 [Vibrio phage pVco-5]
MKLCKTYHEQDEIPTVWFECGGVTSDCMDAGFYVEFLRDGTSDWVTVYGPTINDQSKFERVTKDITLTTLSKI